MKHTCENGINDPSCCEACMRFEVELWDAINSYAIAVGGDPQRAAHVYDNVPRMQAVADIAKVIANAEAARLRAALIDMKVFVVHVYDAADHLHDYYVHQTADGALRQAAFDVVSGRFENADPDFFEAEVRRVFDAVEIEPGVGRRHVRCDAWRAHVDEMPLYPGGDCAVSPISSRACEFGTRGCETRHQMSKEVSE